jgi:hypothetical protein
MGLTLHEVEKVWLAAVIDCEGSIVIFQDKIPPHYVRVHLSIYNTDMRLLDRFKQLASKVIPADRVHIRTQPGKKDLIKSRKIQYVLNINDSWCLRFIREIESFLIIKKEHVAKVRDLPLTDASKTGCLRDMRTGSYLHYFPIVCKR